MEDMLKSSTFLFILSLLLVLVSCTKNNSDQVAQVPTAIETPKENKPADKDFLTKELREAFYYSASLEREALRLILKNNQYDNPTPFSVLSYAVESAKGVKKSAPLSFDCKRFDIQKKQQTLQFFKTCQKPETLLATVTLSTDQKSILVDFKIKEFGNIIGVATALTNSDIQCELKIENKKLQIFKCNNWAYQTKPDTEIRLKEFIFERSSTKQMHLKGGFFKELVENKKIEIVVPITGQIKIIEKDIEVIDEFANQINPAKPVEPKAPEAPKARACASGDQEPAMDQDGHPLEPCEPPLVEPPSEAIFSPETTPPPPSENPGR